MNRRAIIIACVLLALAGMAQAQSNTTSLQLTVGPEAALTVTTGTTNLATTGTNFTIPYTGTTNFTYQIRTSKTSGTGTITSIVTTDFGPAGGPSVTTPPTTGDALTYTCTISAPGTACSAQTASHTAATPVATFGAAASSAKAGNTGSVAWSLTDDPVYATGAYAATVTYTISAT